MEKRNYVKPVFVMQEINNVPFMATSSLVYDDDDPKFAAVIEDCFRVWVTINGTTKKSNVTNDEIKGYFTNTDVTSVCLKTDVLSTCKAEGLSNDKNYSLSYNKLSEVFVISDTDCTTYTQDLTYTTTNNN